MALDNIFIGQLWSEMGLKFMARVGLFVFSD